MRQAETTLLRDVDESFRQVETRLRAFVRRRVSNADDADDLVQAILLKAIKAASEQRTIPNLTGWLFTVARTTIIDHYRKREPIQDHDLIEMALFDDDGSSAQGELAACLRPMIDRLDPKLRNTIIAADLGGEKLADIAARELVSVSAIKSRASRGRRQLKEQLQRCCELQMSAGGGITDWVPRLGSRCGKC